MTQALVVILVLAALLYAMPVLTRADIFFAVTVAPQFRATPIGRAVTRRYRWHIAITAVLAAGVISLLGGATRAGLLSGLVLFAAGSFAAFLFARHAVRPHGMAPSPVREGSLSPRAHRLPGGWAGQAGPFVLLAGASALMRARWADLPDRVPVHWTIDGGVDRWADRTAGGVYAPIVMTLVASSVLLVLATVVLGGSRRIRAEGESAEREEWFRRLILLMVLACEYALALSAAGAGLLEAFHRQPNIWLVVVPVFLVVVGFAAALANLGQGGARRATAAAAGEGPVGDRTADRYWVAGVIYVNGDDPAVLVERRFGIGYTLNLGNPRAWLLIVLVVAILGFGRVIVRYL